MQRTWLIGGCLIAAISVFLSPLPSAPLDQRAPAVKLIEYGWDSPSAEFVRAHVAEMERRPFDGVIVRLSDGGGDVFQPAKWNAETLALQLPILRDIKWQSFDSNFLAMYATSSMDWYDDRDWRAVTEHAAFMARAAREGRCRGVMFDPEPYGPNPWNYSSQLRASAHTFAEYEVVVRRRGREFMRALQREYPGLELLTLHSYSHLLRTSATPDVAVREKILARHAWGLLPAYLNGMLEEADSNSRIIDGHEDSYFFERPEENRSYRIPAGGGSQTIPSYGTGTLGYRSAVSDPKSSQPGCRSPSRSCAPSAVSRSGGASSGVGSVASKVAGTGGARAASSPAPSRANRRHNTWPRSGWISRR